MAVRLLSIIMKWLALSKHVFGKTTPIDTDEDKLMLQRSSVDETWSSNEAPSAGPLRRHSNRYLCLLTFNAALLVVNILCILFWVGKSSCSERECTKVLSSFSPALPHINYETVTFKDFTASSPYKGYPTDEIDAMWEDLDLAGYVSISKKDLVEKLGKNDTYAALDGTNGQEYIGSMEVFHQIHCLNLIRKFTYEDYYRKQDPPPFAFGDPPAILRKHVDHCIDYLREAIMCAGDVGVYMSFWVENRVIPWPDFEVEHKCRSWDSIVTYANEAARGIHLPSKPTDAVVYKHPNHHKVGAIWAILKCKQEKMEEKSRK